MIGCCVSSGKELSSVSSSQTRNEKARIFPNTRAAKSGLAMSQLPCDQTNTQRCYRATEMDITMIGLQNAGKTSLARVLAVCTLFSRSKGG